MRNCNNEYELIITIELTVLSIALITFFNRLQTIVL